MKKEEIVVGGKYLIKVSGKVVPVQVNSITERSSYSSSGRGGTNYRCTNLITNRGCVARSAQKFRSECDSKGRTTNDKAMMEAFGADFSGEPKEDNITCNLQSAGEAVHVATVIQKAIGISN